jgi:hypothetical protein
MVDALLNTTKRSRAIAAICDRDPAIASIVATLSSRQLTRELKQSCGQVLKNAFESASGQDFEELTKLLPVQTKNHAFPTAPVFEGNLHCSEFIPIRAFKSDLARVWGAVENLRIFLSSGTTSGPEGRSRSAFSPSGLLFYRAGSIVSFLSALETLATPSSVEFLDIRFFSLIPPTKRWPDSSLAQMIEWFSTYWQTTYLDNVERSQFVETINSAQALGKPVVFWGTAFHFVNLFEDQTIRFKLPRGSIIVETGGTKGQSRSVSRAELYQLITQGFDVEPRNILSEYGMCELACQAWDIASSDDSERTLSASNTIASQETSKDLAFYHTHLQQRTFRFPWWVRTAVMSNPTIAASQGLGALTIYDPLRIDLPGVAIQTEDMANRYNSGSFSLLGRVPTAPLKGCSLRAEQILSAPTMMKQTASKSPERFYEFSLNQSFKRASLVQRWLKDLVKDDEALQRLTAEFNDSGIAHQAVTDLVSGLPVDTDGFLQAAKNSIGQQMIGESWLMIPPSSHSMALIHPLACALTLGLSVRVRLPKMEPDGTESSFLAKAIDLAKTLGFEITTLPSSWRLGPNDLLDGESVLLFGDDETAKFVGNFSNERASLFGNALSLSLVTWEDIDSAQSIRLLLRDQISLAQRGCLSSRAVISAGGSYDSWIRAITACQDLRPRHETIAEQTARSIETTRFCQLGFEVFTAMPGVTIPVKKVSFEKLATEAVEAISRLDFVFPVLLVPDITDTNRLIGNLLNVSSLRAIAAGKGAWSLLAKSESYPNLVKYVRLVRLGSLGAPPLDGLHFGRPFFATKGSFALH